jgi:LuxR family transcriptional regulator, quorum-sensing system regulator BjaR1
MLLTDTGSVLLEHLERQKDSPSLLASFQRLILAFGMDHFCIGDPSNPEVRRDDRRWGATWPVRWYWHYVSHNHFAHDPVMAAMNRAQAPYRWSTTYARASARGRRVLDEASEFGIRDGFAVPIHQPDGRVMGVSIATASYHLTPQDALSLHMASLYLHARMAGLRGGSPARPAFRLTPRERECLEWVAAGKTDWEISLILSISEQTAHGYVQNALTKLGARTRAAKKKEDHDRGGQDIRAGAASLGVRAQRPRG